MQDGKKRAVFAMINFLGKLGWNKLEIDKFLMDWNQKNPEPLRENIIKGQLAHFKKETVILPPNCNNEGYYSAFQVCKPDGLCKKIKNPVNYTMIKYKIFLEEKKKQEEEEAKQAAKEQRKKLKQERDQRRKQREEKKKQKQQAEELEEQELRAPKKKKDQGTKTMNATETINLPPAKHKNLGLAIIYNDQNKILLQDRSDSISKFGEKWGCFGGKIEEGETPKEATIRELQEELEFDISNKPFQLLGHYEDSAVRTSGLTQSVSIDMFLVPITSEETKGLILHEGAGMKWFTVQEALKLKMCPWDIKILKDLDKCWSKEKTL